MSDRRVRIIDTRSKEKYMMDDAYLNGYARLCGWKGTLVYMSLCRHVSKDQYCFPSIVLMSQEHAVSRDTVIDGLKTLEDWNIIEIGKDRKKNGTWLNNTYILMDKTVWKPKPKLTQVDHSDMAIQVDNSLQPSRPQRLNQVDHSDTKETHREGNTYKETHLSSKTDVLQEGAKEKLYAIDSLSIPYGRTPNNSNSNNTATPKVVAEESSIGKQVGEIMSLFKKISPALKYNDTTQRKACQEMIEFCGFGKAKEACEVIISVQGETYAPRASTPFIAWKKFGDFKSFIDQKKSNKPKVIKV